MTFTPLLEDAVNLLRSEGSSSSDGAVLEDGDLVGKSSTAASVGGLCVGGEEFVQKCYGTTAPHRERSATPLIYHPYPNGYNVRVAQAPKNFLVIEDNADDAVLIRRAFKATDSCQAFVSRTLTEAKAHLQRAGMYRDEEKFPTPDAVICDMHLGMDSALDFLNWKNANDEFRLLPVFILTGTASSSECGRARGLGALEVLRKPMKYEDLRGMVQVLAAKLCAME